jgi:alkanesulfonate monooxygenase SsuD/methylene tetrahydromethanopterin reductase-like flavin-dependent oxidoreductase (luciferase family)
MRIGLLLPHFSDQLAWDNVVGIAPRVEVLGFDSVWVRDNLNYEGHGFELPGRPFADPFTTLAAVAGATTTLGLGTAVAVPFRHPVLTAQIVGSLAWVAHGRLELGIGPGAPRGPFDALGVPYDQRIDLCQDTVDVLRLLAGPGTHDFSGRVSAFESVAIEPRPPADLTVWYGGASSASVRRAVAYCDGLLPGQCPFGPWQRAKDRMNAAAWPARGMLRMGSIPLVSLGDSRADALRKIEARSGPLLDYLNTRWKLELSRVEEAGGALMFGSVEDVTAALQEFEARDAELVVLDARLIMNEFADVVETIGREVLPAFKQAR